MRNSSNDVAKRRGVSVISPSIGSISLVPGRKSENTFDTRSAVSGVYYGVEVAG